MKINETIKEYVANEKLKLAEEIRGLKIKPHLLIIQMNNDPASNAYVKGKLKDCEEIGAIATLISLSEETSQDELFKMIETYNNDDSIHGIIVQMPLPKHINEDLVKQTVCPKKDVDGFNILSNLNPCTPYGILNYLKHIEFDFVGKNAVVVGRSNIVGKPMAKMLLKESCAVTVLHSKVNKEDMKFYIEHADLVVAAVGKKHILNGFNFKENAILIDVGISRDEGKLYGDIPAGQNVLLQTPVPGGVGLITRLTLMQNLMETYKNLVN